MFKMLLSGVESKSGALTLILSLRCHTVSTLPPVDRLATAGRRHPCRRWKHAIPRHQLGYLPFECVTWARMGAAFHASDATGSAHSRGTHHAGRSRWARRRRRCRAERNGPLCGLACGHQLCNLTWRLTWPCAGPQQVCAGVTTASSSAQMMRVFQRHHRLIWSDITSYKEVVQMSISLRYRNSQHNCCHYGDSSCFADHLPLEGSNKWAIAVTGWWTLRALGFT